MRPRYPPWRNFSRLFQTTSLGIWGTKTLLSIICAAKYLSHSLLTPHRVHVWYLFCSLPPVPASYDVALEEWRWTIRLRYVRAHVCQGGRLQDPNRLFIACLHEKFSARPPEKHQSTPGLRRANVAKNTNTLPLLYPCIALRLCTHTLSSSAVLHFPRPFGSYRCEGGKRGKGKGKEGWKGARARPPCSHGRPECLHLPWLTL